MAIYLGATGRVNLRRPSDTTTTTFSLNSADVNTTSNRFGFEAASKSFFTGDRITISATSTLLFVSPSGWIDGVARDQGTWYIHVDLMGGVYLYPSFSSAVAGEIADRIALQKPAITQEISVSLAAAPYKTLGEITSYELNTERNSADVTTLSDSFREQYSTLISGGGTIECLFDYAPPAGYAGIVEKPVYLHQLITRQTIGSEFQAQLYVVRPGSNPARPTDSLWYELTGLLTNVGISFESDDAVRSRLQFVTTGPVVLKVGTPL